MKLYFGIALTFFLALPIGVDSCGIPPPAPVFSTTKRPADPSGEFLRGKLGVIQPTYRKHDLIAAYRVLSGIPLSPAEAQSFYPDHPAAPPDPFDRSDTAPWIDARNRLAGLSPIESYAIRPFKSDPVTYQYFRNCLNDAFDNARKTIIDRAKRWGEESDQLRQWAQAQDVVFQNCAGTTPQIPNAPPASADPLLAADRQYQIAAAHFYAGQWPQAQQAFDHIAQDRSSPWRSIAPYLAARVAIRQGLIANQPDALRDAARRLQVLADDPRHEWSAASRRLLNFVRLRIDPLPRLKELAESLSNGVKQANPAEELAEFVYLYNRITSATEAAAASDLTAWLLALEHRSPDRILQQYRNKRNPAWLIAALIAGSDSKDFEEILREARRIPPTSPAYESAAYYGIAHEIASGHRDAARRWADEALRQKLTLSTRNRILTERLKLSRNWSEFLRFAPRRPEPHVADYDYSEVNIDEPPVITKTAPIFDTDAAGLLNRRIPLRLWFDAANNSLLPPHLQLRLAQSGWFRAVLLDKNEEARQFMQRIVALQPTAAKTAREFLDAKDTRSARFTAVFLMMRAPMLYPDIPAAGLHLSDLSRLHDRTVNSGWGFAEVYPPPPAPASFLTPAERSEAEDEWQRLRSSAPYGADYLTRAAIEWARQHPEDPRVPQALHLAVRGTRLGCKSTDTGKYSREAFTILHQRYPKSEWTAKTKYWYK